MTAFAEQLNFLSAIGTVALLMCAVVLFVLLLIKGSTVQELRTFIARYAVLFAFLLALLGTIVSLIYSEVIGFVPCGLCWFQRIFLYPQVILFGVALWTKEKTAVLSSIVLSALGAVFALYHHLLQVSGSHLIGCPTAGGDCGQRYIYEFGFVTFPLMALTFFVLIIVLMLYVKKYGSN